MTTIAWKDGILACDSQGTLGNQKMKAGYKAIIDEENGKVFAITGSLVKGLRFIADLQTEVEPNKRCKLKGTVVMEFDLKTGNLVCWESRYLALPLEQKLWADGSGGQFAMGAMEAGASAEEAVKVAAKHDCYTGFKIQVWESERAKRRRK